jgi:hypothetical protein
MDDLSGARVEVTTSLSNRAPLDREPPHDGPPRLDESFERC